MGTANLARLSSEERIHHARTGTSIVSISPFSNWAQTNPVGVAHPPSEEDYIFAACLGATAGERRTCCVSIDPPATRARLHNNVNSPLPPLDYCQNWSCGHQRGQLQAEAQRGGMGRSVDLQMQHLLLPGRWGGVRAQIHWQKKYKQ